MAGLMKRDTKGTQPVDIFDRFDHLFEDWAQMLPFRRPLGGTRAWMSEDAIRVEQFKEDGTIVVRAELPGIDPEKDASITVADGMLNIEAERREEQKSEERGYTRRELRYGSFSRSIPLPEGVSADDVNATYKDGMLEIRIPAPKEQEAKKISVTKS